MTFAEELAQKAFALAKRIPRTQSISPNEYVQIQANSFEDAARWVLESEVVRDMRAALIEVYNERYGDVAVSDLDQPCKVALALAAYYAAYEAARKGERP